MIGNQYKVYYKGLHKRPTYESLINYLQDGQETIYYPDRRAKQMRNHPYLTQLDGEGMDMMDLQQMNAIKYMMDQNAMRNEASRPGGGGMPELRADASGPSSSSSSSSSVMSGAGSISGMGYESIPDSEEWRALRRVRPPFLPSQTPSVHRITPSPSIASDDIGDASRLFEGSMETGHMAVADAEQDKDDDEKKRIEDIRRIAKSYVDDLSKTVVDKMLIEQQNRMYVEETERQRQQQRDISLERRRQHEKEGGSVARAFSPAHQGKTIQVRGRSPSVRTIHDLPETGGASSSARPLSIERRRISGKQTAVGVDVLEPVVEGLEDFSVTKKDTGVNINNYFDYWEGRLHKSKDNIKVQFDKRPGLKFDNNKVSIDLIAELMNYDRRKKGMEGIATVQKVGRGKIIQIIYPSK